MKLTSQTRLHSLESLQIAYNVRHIQQLRTLTTPQVKKQPIAFSLAYPVALFAKFRGNSASAGIYSLSELPSTSKIFGYRALEIDDQLLLPTNFLSRLMRKWWGMPAFSKNYPLKQVQQLRHQLLKYDTRCLGWKTNSDFTLSGVKWIGQVWYLLNSLKAAKIVGAKFIRLSLGGNGEKVATNQKTIMSRLVWFAHACQQIYPELKIIIDFNAETATETKWFLELITKWLVKLPASQRKCVGISLNAATFVEQKNRYQRTLLKLTHHIQLKRESSPHGKLPAFLKQSQFQGMVSIMH